MILSLAVVAISLLIGFQLCTCVPVLSNSFNCSLNISGSSKYGEDLNFIEASVECIPGPDTAATAKLAMLLHESLRPHLMSFNGRSGRVNTSGAAYARAMPMVSSLLAGVEVQFSVRLLGVTSGVSQRLEPVVNCGA